MPRAAIGSRAGGDWYCPLCANLRLVDERFKTTARVRVWWDAYGEYFEGWVIGVRAATEKEKEKAKTRRKALYHVFYSNDDTQWEFVKDSEFLPVDEAATALAKSGDALLGRRVEVWHEKAGVVEAGFYAGVVRDLRVEREKRFASKVFHLVKFDAGDVHWHDLATVRWREVATLEEAAAVVLEWNRSGAQ